MHTDPHVSDKKVVLNDEERSFLIRLAQGARRTWEKDLDWAASHKAIKRRDHAAQQLTRIDNLIAKLEADEAVTE